MSAAGSAGSAVSEARALPSSGGLVCVEAQAALRLTTGRRCVPIEELGRAVFNRFAEPLSGWHVLGLAQKIVKPGVFAT